MTPMYLLQSRNGKLHRPRFTARALCGAKTHGILAFVEDIYDPDIGGYRDVTRYDVTCSRCREIQEKLLHKL